MWYSCCLSSSLGNRQYDELSLLFDVFVNFSNFYLFLWNQYCILIIINHAWLGCSYGLNVASICWLYIYINNFNSCFEVASGILFYLILCFRHISLLHKYIGFIHVISNLIFWKCWWKFSNYHFQNKFLFHYQTGSNRFGFTRASHTAPVLSTSQTKD